MRRGFKRATVVAFLVFLTWSGGITLAGEPTDNPILIIPGILGSQLWARLNRTSVNHIYCRKTSDWFNVWLNLEELLYPFEKCASENMRLHYDPGTKEFSNVEGVDTQIRDFGNTTSVEYLDPSTKFWETTNYFHDMVEYFVKQGYVRGQTIRAAPFDWRFAPLSLKKQGFFDKVKLLVEDMYHTYNSPITLVVHSMGGPISLYFLTQFVDQAWKDTYIKQYITISAVWAGSLKSVRSLISGDNEGIFIDKPIWGRPSQRTFQSTYFLLPPPGDVWDNKTILVYTPNGQYTAYDYQKLFTSLNYTLGWEFYQMISDPTTRFPPPNVTTYCYYGLGLDTLKELHYSVSNYPDSPPNVSTCDGDGTVPYMSLKVCERWKTQQSYKVHSQSFQNAEHVKILKTPQVIQTVANLIKSS